MSAKKGNIATQAHALVEPAIETLGYDLVDVEYKKEGKDWFLRFFIDKRGGIGIQDCEVVSKTIDPMLDEGIEIPGSYQLEVSSPGLDRPLKTTRDLLRYRGREVEVKLYAPIDGERKLTGYIVDATDEVLTLSDEPPLDEQDEPLEIENERTVERTAIAKVSQVIKF